ncbi:unnamed protein product [Symbiodinium necroappetens]|uniref:Uncharacterized protein n=1 Tax=Symbiodinium necroappetens TaxID=1628268 RepID=A0A812UGF7_9DINO|nr:unnamed protein product [Symbiodinium necroappetens]|mmetsp:Transcript_77164/g.184774  ORF Transcript_77164/g.184774 Transcript_77164/m.184774 type:complete len:104 (+) Transcript_77164:56-367(+)
MVFPLLLVLMGLGSALRHVQVTNDAGAANESQKWGWLWHQEVITCSCIDGEEFTTWAKCREACDKWCGEAFDDWECFDAKAAKAGFLQEFSKELPGDKEVYDD